MTTSANTPTGRRRVPFTSLPKDWQTRLLRLRDLDNAYITASEEAREYREHVAAESGRRAASVKRTNDQHYAALADAREKARVARSEAMISAVEAGVSMYRIAQFLELKSGTSHVKNLVDGTKRRAG